MTQIGTAIAQNGSEPWVWIAFGFICFGFLTKAAIVPFHFWLADAHAVAPAPVSALFSGIMVPLGLFAVQKVYGLVFSQAFATEHHRIEQVFLWMGVASTLLGHGFIKASLFMTVGIWLHRTRSVDEKELFCKGFSLIPANILYLTATLGIAGLPPFSTFAGHHEFEKALHEAQQEWLSYVLIAGTALTAGTLFSLFSSRTTLAIFGQRFTCAP